MWELQPQVCLSEFISPPILSISQSIWFGGKGKAISGPSQSHLLYLQSSWARRRVYVGAGAAGVIFRPNVSISLVQFS